MRTRIDSNTEVCTSPPHWKLRSGVAELGSVMCVVDLLCQTVANKKATPKGGDFCLLNP